MLSKERVTVNRFHKELGGGKLTVESNCMAGISTGWWTLQGCTSKPKMGGVHVGDGISCAGGHQSVPKDKPKIGRRTRRTPLELVKAKVMDRKPKGHCRWGQGERKVEESGNGELRTLSSRERRSVGMRCTGPSKHKPVLERLQKRGELGGSQLGWRTVTRYKKEWTFWTPKGR